MKLSDIRDILHAEIIVGQERLDMHIKAGIGSDLMSDIMWGPTSGAVLLTGLNNIQCVRSSIISGVAAIVLVRGKRPTPEVEARARAQGMPLLSTPFTMYSACGRLFAKGLRGVEEKASKPKASQAEE